MSSTIFWSVVCVVAPFIYTALGGKPADTKDKEARNYEKETYEYFSSLTLEDQERYYKENLDLNYYKDDLSVGFTNDRYVNARHAEEIARKTGKCFTDKNKVY